MPANATPIQPVSDRLPAIFAYPAHKAMLWMIAALCALRLLNHLPSLLGMVFELAFWVMGFKLAVEALVNTVHGRFEPMGAEDMMATDGEAMNQILLMLVVFLPIQAIAFWGSPALALWLLAFAVLFLPAAVMLLAVDDNLPQALNPLAWFPLIARLGERLGETFVLADIGVDEVGLVLVRTVGLCPPGTFVRLDNGDIAVVLRRSDKANMPVVASLLDRNNNHLSEPLLHPTAHGKPRIQSALARTAVTVELNHRTMVRLGLYAATQPSQTARLLATQPASLH